LFLKLNLFETEPLADLKEIPIDNFAFIGDAIINLRFKLKLLGDGRFKTGNIFIKTKDYLSAKSHFTFVEMLMPEYNEEEIEVFKRALNSKGAKKKGNDIEYRKSTAFEAVFGYLYLKKDYERLNYLLEIIEKNTIYSE